MTQHDPVAVVSTVAQGFLFTAARYASQNSREAAPVEAPRVLPTATSAVRAMRVQIRTAHVFGMTPRETARAIEWADSGWLYALGLLNSGHHAGFTVVFGSGAVAEWSVHPVQYLELRTAGPCRALERSYTGTELSS
ncbi:hypothetical protein [Streptomyces sp. NPDC056387]|uniref:hypothetical protein n=1 Tax=Streptomyces sp. NPDC056387 TaxID=3345803 RepID=UPI0035DE36AE